MLNDAPILALQISVKPEHFNRDDMTALAKRLSQDFCHENQLAVAICDDYKVAKDTLLITQFLIHGPNPAMRGGYDLNRTTGKASISFSTVRGRLLDEVRVFLDVK